MLRSDFDKKMMSALWGVHPICKSSGWRGQCCKTGTAHVHPTQGREHRIAHGDQWRNGQRAAPEAHQTPWQGSVSGWGWLFRTTLFEALRIQQGMTAFMVLVAMFQETPNAGVFCFSPNFK
jgi:hypothetical protein